MVNDLTLISKTGAGNPKKSKKLQILCKQLTVSAINLYNKISLL